nr:hypothetical protein [Tanacetum cinerariifolium]
MHCHHLHPTTISPRYHNHLGCYTIATTTISQPPPQGSIPSKTAADANIAIQEMAEYSHKWHNGTSKSRSTETSNGLVTIQAQLNNLGREIKKVNEKVYAAQVGCEQCKGPHYTKDCPLKEEGKTLKEAYYTQFGEPFQGGGYKAATPGFYQRNNVNPLYQEQRQSMEDTLCKFMSESAKRHEENSDLIKEIRASMDAAVQNQRSSIKTLEVQIGQMSKVLKLEDLEFYLALLKRTREIKSNMPEDIKVPLILGRPFLSTARAKIDVYKIKITLRVGEERIVLTSIKPTSCLIKRVYMLSLRERMELDLEARLMGDNLVLNRSLDPFFEDYIELNDLNEPIKLRKNQGDDLMHTIEEGEVIKEFRTKDEDLDIVTDDYPSYCDYDKKIHIDFTYQMVRSHPRFKRHTNEQCNKIPPLLKVSDEDKMNGISHPYQKLKGFYKGVLNLGPDYIQDAKMEEWLTRGHISVHEMK